MVKKRSSKGNKGSPIKSVLFLGTSAATPTRTRSVTSHALMFQDGSSFLLDCGEGTQHQLVKCKDIKTAKISAILITHLHGDHCFGIPGLLASMSLLSGITTLRVVGPKGIKNLIETSIGLSDTYITYDLKITELEAGKVKELGALDGFHTVTAFPLVHKVPCFGYVVSEPNKAPALDAAKAMSLWAKGPMLGTLKRGEDVEVDGKVIKASEVLSAPQKGKKVVLLGDTSDSSSIMEAAKDCDMVVHECTFDKECKEKAILGGHSTSEMAGHFAKEIAAKKLVLTHFSQRYSNASEDEINIDVLVKEATKASEGCCEVVAAEDFLIVPVD